MTATSSSNVASDLWSRPSIARSIVPGLVGGIDDGLGAVRLDAGCFEVLDGSVGVGRSGPEYYSSRRAFNGASEVS